MRGGRTPRCVSGEGAKREVRVLANPIRSNRSTLESTPYVWNISLCEVHHAPSLSTASCASQLTPFPHHSPQVHFGDPPEDKILAKLDAAIGRTAHISFLDNDAFVQMFVYTYLQFFA